MSELRQCSACGAVATPVNGVMPPHGSPGPATNEPGCPGSGKPPAPLRKAVREAKPSLYLSGGELRVYDPRQPAPVCLGEVEAARQLLAFSELLAACQAVESLACELLAEPAGRPAKGDSLDARAARKACAVMFREKVAVAVAKVAGDGRT